MLSIAAIPPTPGELKPDNHYKLEFADIDEPNTRNIGIAAQEHHIERIIDLAKAWDGRKPVLVNCRQGHRRSPSATLIILCARNPGNEHAMYRLLKEEAPYINLKPANDHPGG